MPSRVLIGSFLIQMGGLKEELLAKFDRTVDLLMQLICSRGRAAADDVSKEFAAMFEKLQEQPKDIEKLTEISEFMLSLDARSEELQESIGLMTEHFEALEDLQFETPQDDFSALAAIGHLLPYFNTTAPPPFAGGRTDDDDDATTSATAVTAPALSVFGGGSNDGGVLATPSVAAAAFVSDHSTLERGAKRFRAASFATEM